MGARVSWGVWRREHVRGRGATIVGTSIDLPSPASEKGRKKVPKPRGNSDIAAGLASLTAGCIANCGVRFLPGWCLPQFLGLLPVLDRVAER